MKIVVTGSSGSLAEGVISVTLASTAHSLVLVDRNPPSEGTRIQSSRVEYVTANLRDYDSCLKAVKGADALIHLAAYAQPYHAHPSEIHNANVILSWNALTAAVEAGIKKVVMASSINAAGGCWDPGVPVYDYFPVDENAPIRCMEAYSISKYVGEIQAESIARANPDMTIASFRFHHVIPKKKDLAPVVETTGKDLWGWTSSDGAARACLLAIEAPWKGHEMMYIVADDHAAFPYDAAYLAKRFYPTTEIRGGRLTKDQSFYSCAKAERVLGWKHDGGKQPRANL